MAESIVKLKVDSREFDSRIRNAAQGLSRLEDSLRGAGKSFNDVSKDQISYVRSLGDMGTKCTSAKGKVGELTAAFTDLSAQYRRMTDEEKKGEYGKALSESLGRLKARIQEGRVELNEINASLSDTGNQSNAAGGSLSALTEKFGLSIPKVTGLGVALGATGAALKVAKDSFLSSESNIDEWGRVVDSAKSVYTSFVAALNSSNFSGFFSGLNGVIAKAREAYDALDELGTRMSIINPERAKLQARQQQLQSTIRREGADSAAGRQAQEQLRALEPQLSKSYKTEAGLNWNAFEKQVDKRLAEYGIKLDKTSKELLMKSFHDDDAFRRIRAGAKGSITYEQGPAATTSWGGSYTSTRRVDNRNVNQKLLDAFSDDWRSENSGYITAAFNALGQSYGMLKGNARYLNAGSGGSGGGGGRVTGGGGSGGGTHQMTPQEKAEQVLSSAMQSYSDTIHEADMRMEAGLDQTLDHQKRELQAMSQLLSAYARASAIYDDPKYQEAYKETAKSYSELAATIKKTEEDTKNTNDWLNEISREPHGVINIDHGESSYNSRIAENIAANNIDADANTLANLVEVALKNGLDNVNIPSDYLAQQIFGEGINIPDTYWQDLVSQINEQLANLGIDPIQLDVNTGNLSQAGKQVKSSWQDAAGAISAAGGALRQLENPTAKIAGIIGEAIANIALGFANASKNSGGEGNVWSWIAATAAGLGTMISTISAIKSATAGSYAEGGIIPGHSYSGDRLTANVNAGELILNRAQQGNIASQLEGGLDDLRLETDISAEKFRIMLNTNSRRRGHGEYVTSRAR